MSDAAYQVKYLHMARLLWDCSQSNSTEIPSEYTNYLSHSYVDGDISLVPTVSKFEFTEGLDEEEWCEAVELLSKVSEKDWPFIEDIIGVNVEELLKIYDEDASNCDFVEDNLGTAEKIQKGLAAVIESVLGEKVDNIRSVSGGYPTPDNNFLQETDGTFAGSFSHGSYKFNFEIFPDESGWTATYRLDAATLDTLPPLHGDDDDAAEEK